MHHIEPRQTPDPDDSGISQELKSSVLESPLSKRNASYIAPETRTLNHTTRSTPDISDNDDDTDDTANPKLERRAVLSKPQLIPQMTTLPYMPN